MYLDAENEFSDDQAITVTAPSTNHIDLKNTVNRSGKPPELIASVKTAFTASGAATLVIAIQDSADGSSWADIAETDAIGKATLVAGYDIPLPRMPKKTRRYVRLYYTVATGPMTAGEIIAALAADKQSNGYDVIAETNALL